jgi:hypothetical protein
MKLRFIILAILLLLLASILAKGQVVINEFMAQNTKTITDPQGEYEDWIELKNVGAQKVELSGMYLSDNPTNPLKWKFPDNTEIPAGGYLIVWADEDGKAISGLHANFKLSATGEIIMLFDKDTNGNKLLDSVTFGFQNPDQSFGRYPDGASKWQIFSHPTPGAQNDNTTSVAENSNLPAAFSLEQNYPNPFNPSTTINWQIAVGCNVTLKVYDMLGREVTTLVDEFEPAGSYNTKFSSEIYRGESLPSGIYIYTFQAGQFIQSKKMIVLK